MKIYRTGIIGLGKIGVEFEDNHMTAYRDCPNTKLVALCDINESSLFRWREVILGRAHFYTDFASMAGTEQLDIISVCTPPETHCRIVCGIAPYVKAIYCEKPIAFTLEDADKMIETCHKHNVILQINHQRRFTMPKFRFSRGIINTGTHAFDLLRQIFGECVFVGGKYWTFGKTKVEIEYVPTDEPLFELDCTHSKERMILKGVEHLVGCLDNGSESISSGEEAKLTLSLALKMDNFWRFHI